MKPLIKIPENTSKILTDFEWNFYWMYGRKYWSTVEEYEQNIDEERKRREIFSAMLTGSKPLM